MWPWNKKKKSKEEREEELSLDGEELIKFLSNLNLEQSVSFLLERRELSRNKNLNLDLFFVYARINYLTGR